MKEKNTISLRSVVLIIVLSVLISATTGGVVGFFAGWLAQQPNTGQLHWPWSNNPSNSSVQPVSTQSEKITKVVEESATTNAVKNVSPAVVSVVITKDLSSLNNSTGPNPFPFDNFFQFGFPFNFQFNAPQGKQDIGGGTGFVVDAEQGYIITNKHVVSDTEAEYSVLTNDGERHDAQVLARDPLNDIAILQVTADNLTAVQLGDSDSLQIGQTVIAIGNALGEYRNTVTRGVISGINRDIVAGGSTGGSEQLQGTIQTDAAINPGNSGGPLVNLDGQVIAMNTAIDQQGQSIGFAIPINEVKQVFESVEKYGRIIRPYLGVRYQMINSQLADNNNLPVDYGALIVRGDNQSDLAVIPGSPADKVGLVENDIILEVNGVKLNDDNTLSEVIRHHQVGDKITLKILHRGEEKTVTVELGEYQE